MAINPTANPPANRQKDFIAEIKTKGLSRTNRFTVDFTPPRAMGENTKRCLLFCEKATIPGINFATTQNRTFGEFRETPYDRLFDPVTLTFHVDRNMTVKKIFDDWIYVIQDPKSKSFAWYSEYISPLTIRVQDLEDKVHYELVCHEAYPKSIGQIQLDAESKDTMRLDVTFQYKYWTAAQIDQNAYGQLLTHDSLTMYNNNFTGFQERFRKGLGEAGNFLTGAVGQIAMRSGASLASRVANSSVVQRFTTGNIKIPTIKF